MGRLSALRGRRGTFGDVPLFEMRNDFRDYIVLNKVRRLPGWGARYPICIVYCTCDIAVRWFRRLAVGGVQHQMPVNAKGEMICLAGTCTVCGEWGRCFDECPLLRARN